MRRIKILLGIGLCSLLGTPTAYGQVRPEKEKAILAVNWTDFMEKQNMVWEQLPVSLQDAPFMGNGRLGLIICKSPVENEMRFITGHTEVVNHLTDSRILGGELLPTGYFSVQPKGKILKGRITLDLWNAETHTEVWTDRGKIKILSFVHGDEQVIINRISTEGNEPQPVWTWHVPQEYSKTAGSTESSSDIRISTFPKGGKSLQKLSSGGETAVLWYQTEQKESNNFYITINHAYPDTLAVEMGKHEFRSVLRKGFRRVREAHRSWWHDFYSASFVSLPNDTLENFYWAQMYKMGVAMREDAISILHSEPYATHVYWPNRQWNMNVHSIYTPVNGANHNDLARPLERAFYNPLDEEADSSEALKPRETWRRINRLFGRRGTQSDEPAKAKERIDHAQVIWACHNLWIIYRHKMDDQLLQEKLYPLLRQATQRYINLLEEDSQGVMHLQKTFQGQDMVVDNNFDLSLLRWSCQTLISITRRLQIDDPQITEWQRILKKLSPLKIENGVIVADSMQSEYPYHLLGIYPFHTLNIEQKGKEPLIQNSIKAWMDAEGQKQFFPYAIASSFQSAVRNGELAESCLKQMIEKQITTNSMARFKQNMPGLGGMQGIHNMLIQSWNGIIRIFPALPESWKDVSFYHLRTEGAFLVSAKKEGGKTTFIEVTNTMGELCTIELDFDNPEFETSRRVRITRIADRTYNIPIRKGESVRIYPKGKHTDCDIHAVENGSGQYFGQK